MKKEVKENIRNISYNLTHISINFSKYKRLQSQKVFVANHKMQEQDILIKNNI